MVTVGPALLPLQPWQAAQQVQPTLLLLPMHAPMACPASDVPLEGPRGARSARSYGSYGTPRPEQCCGHATRASAPSVAEVSTAPSEASPRFQDADKLVSRISASTARRIRRKRAAEREAKADAQFAQTEDKRGASPLFAASDKGNVAVVRFLLDCGARVNLQGGPDHGTHAVVTFASPLYAGCQNCNEEIVQILLDARADVNERTGDGATALMVAAQNGNEKVYRRVLAACDTTTINLEDPTGLMALYFGAQNGHTGIVGMLLKANASTDVRSLDGATPLFKAAQNGHQEVVVPLLQHRADVFAAAHDGTTPLILAAYNGHVYVVDVLVPEIINRAGVKGLDISMQSSGATAMFVAAQAGKDGIVRKLGLYGAYVPELLAVEIAHHGSTWVNRHELQLRAGSHPAHAIRDHAGMNIDIAVGCDSIITVYSNTTDPVYIPCGRFAHMQASHVVEMAGRSPNTSALCLDGVLLAPHRYVPGGSEVLICAVSLQAPTLAGPRLNAANMQLRRDLIHVLERHGLGQELLMAMFTKTVDEQVVPGFRLGEAPRSRTSGK
ncbi:Ankrd17 [Symbiodinium sp. CCMP2592]|nr:Ankrd17 [Symbiodinium sp. CCMP2592]